MNQKHQRLVLSAVAAISSVVLMSSCAGSAGSSSGASSSSVGFDYGAAQSNVDAIVEELEPITLTYQANGSSQDSLVAADVKPFVDEVEKRSNGKISIDVVWGQAVAGWDEVDDALADGRLDLAYTINGYNPSEYPGVAELGKLTSSFPKEPLVSDLVMNGALQEIAWTSPEYINDFEDKDLTLLLAAGLGGAYYSYCTSPGGNGDAWKGRQVRSASAGQERLLKGMGANPISLEFTETYEALQRNTIDCTVLATVAAVQDGIGEVAPYVSYSSKNNWAQGGGEYVAGSSFKKLPLAYQQIIFDSMAVTHAAQVKGYIDPTVEIAKIVKDQGGDFEPFDPDLEKTFKSSADELRNEAADSGLLNMKGNEENFDAVVAKWTDIIDTLGYEAGGNIEDFDEWYDPENVDLRPFGKRVFEESSLAHRPS